MRDVLKRLWGPMAIFLFFLSFALWGGGFLSGLGNEAISQSQKVISYTLQVGIWLSAAFFLNRLVAVFIWEGLVSRVIGGSVPRLLKDVVGVLVYLIAITGIVGIVFGRSVTGLWATSGAIGLVIGFALRSIILDVFTGLAIGVDRPYKMGDWIQIHEKRPEQNIIGQVKEMNWRTTRIHTRDGNLVIVPNNMMGTLVITNFMQPALRSRQTLIFCLDFSVPTGRALRVLTAGVRATCGEKQVLESPKPKVRLLRTTPLGVEYRVRYWIVPKDFSPNKARHAVLESTLEHLRQAGMTLAYPKEDVFFEAMPTRHLDTRSVSDRKALLGRIPLFASLINQELETLASTMHERSFSEQDTLIKRGDEGDSMFILLEGLLGVFIDIHGNGQETKIAQIKPGQFFGEMSLLTGEPRSATIIATTDTIAYEITKDNMDELLRQRPELAETITKTIAIRRMEDKQAREELTQEETAAEVESFAQQMMGKMRSFFRGVFDTNGNSKDNLTSS